MDATENEEDDGDSFSNLDLIGFDKHDISFNFGGNKNLLSNGDLDTFFDNIYDVTHPAMKIRET